MTASVLAQFIDLRPSGGFDLICADPPWSFENWSKAGEVKNAKAQYDCTPLEWIKSLPVAALAANDCLLWLWATNPMLPHEIDHIHPVALGGGNDPDNLAVACIACNRSKGAKPLTDWRPRNV
jgi:5-methylcytosine-specific restriction endonuclease McrA